MSLFYDPIFLSGEFWCIYNYSSIRLPDFLIPILFTFFLLLERSGLNLICLPRHSYYMQILITEAGVNL